MIRDEKAATRLFQDGLAYANFLNVEIQHVAVSSSAEQLITARSNLNWWMACCAISRF